jgi:DNA-binding CsgD family transcriptional regulator
MSRSVSTIPEQSPGTAVAASLLAGALVLGDLVALVVVLPVPGVLLMAPLLVLRDRIDLGFWLVDTSPEAWAAAIPGAILVAVIVAVTVKVARRQHAWVMAQVNIAAPGNQQGTSVREDDGLHRLTARESQVLALMSQGLKNGAIAEQLFISEATVRKHIGRIFAKLDLGLGGSDRRVAAVLTYVRQSKSPT